MTQDEHATIPERFPTVLVVDDDVDLLKLCALHLGGVGFSVLMAVGSAEAQETCDAYPAKLDLILLDIMLYPPTVQVDRRENLTPRVHADKLLPILRQKRPLTRILLMSASSPWTLGGRGMGWLVRQYPFLQKPFTKDALIKKVRDVLSSPVQTFKA